MKNKTKVIIFFYQCLLFILVSNTVFSQEIEIFITDFGINQYIDNVLNTGDDFSHAKSCVLPDLPRQCQILVVMPPHQDILNLSNAKIEEIKNNIFITIKSKIQSGIDQGFKKFEIQLIEHIGTQTYVSNTHQKAVNQFGKVVYEAIGKFNNSLQKADIRPSFHGIFGSNGTKVFSENIDSWQSYMKDAIFFDGRAFMSPMVKTIEKLGAQNVQIFNTAGDWLAPNNIFAHSIGNHDVVKQLKGKYPELMVGWIDPLDRMDIVGAGHLAAMPCSDNQKFLMKFWNGEKYSKPLKMSSADLYSSINQKTIRKEGGVKIKIDVNQQTIKQDTSGDLKRLHEKLLKQRSNNDNASWPVKLN